MSHCIIIAGMYRGEEKDGFLKKQPGDLLLCADSGYAAAVRYGMEPDLTLGDFDSMDEKETGSSLRIRFPVKKDDTDLRLCMKEGWKRGYREFRIGGGLGGRFDHTLANLQCLAECASLGGQGWLVDSQNRVTVLSPGEYVYPSMPGRYLSLFAFSETVDGITLQGTEWELQDAQIRQTYPIGCSNWFRDPSFTLRFTRGLLVLAFCGDNHGEN